MGHRKRYASSDWELIGKRTGKVKEGEIETKAVIVSAQYSSRLVVCRPGQTKKAAIMGGISPCET